MITGSSCQGQTLRFDPLRPKEVPVSINQGNSSHQSTVYTQVLPRQTPCATEELNLGGAGTADSNRQLNQTKIQLHRLQANPNIRKSTTIAPVPQGLRYVFYVSFYVSSQHFPFS
jgi:hypothetical protein